MKLRRFGALAGAMVLTLSVAGAVYADSGSPTSVNADVDGMKVTLSGNWTWEDSSCNDSSKKIVGWAVDWGVDGYTDNPVPKSGGGNFYMGDADSGNAVSTDGDLCKNFPGTWGPISHTYAEPGKYTACVIIYDLRDPAPAEGKHSKLAGGPDRNTDNSVEENFDESESVCAATEIIIEAADVSIVKTATPDTLPKEGGLVDFSYHVTNEGNVDLYDIKVTDDAGTPADTSDDWDAVCPKSKLDVGDDMTCTANDVAFGANATADSIVTKNWAEVTAYWDKCNDGCDEAVTDKDDATVTVLTGGVLEETAPPSDTILATTTDAGGALPLLFAILGIVGLGAVVLTPRSARR